MIISLAQGSSVAEQETHNLQVGSSILPPATKVNSKAVGEVAEAIVIAVLIAKGIPVSIPHGNNQRYDAIADFGSRLERIQIKNGRYRKGCVHFATKSTNGFTGKFRSYAGQIESFFIYCPALGTVYRVPVSETSKGMCALRVDPTGNNSTKGIRWADDYLFATAAIKYPSK